LVSRLSTARQNDVACGDFDELNPLRVQLADKLPNDRDEFALGAPPAKSAQQERRFGLAAPA
jgi:hypothetical protein